jgi:hypothetical protein
VSKYEPAVGDTGVIGTVGFVTRNPLGSWAFFFAAVTANGYASIQQDKLSVGLQFCCPFVPEGISEGDWVTADILQGNYAPYAFNLTAL